MTNAKRPPRVTTGSGRLSRLDCTSTAKHGRSHSILRRWRYRLAAGVRLLAQGESPSAVALLLLADHRLDAVRRAMGLTS